jgi:SpoVK/Ycf46/Vps4 family AAA+-type ATPase
MSDTSLRGQVLWIGASNEPDKLDEAFKRPGRFDLKLPFFLPDEAGRRSIFQIMLEHKGEPIPHDLEDEDLDLLASASDGFSGAEIEVVVNDALRLAITQDADHPRLQRHHLDAVLQQYHPEETVRRYRAIEEKIARDIPHDELLPAGYRRSRGAGS